MDILLYYFYQTGLVGTTTFSSWIAELILQGDSLDQDTMSVKVQKRIIGSYLDQDDPSKIHILVTRVFPFEFLLTKENWPSIRQVIKEIINRKKGMERDTAFDSFEKQRELFSKNLNIVMKI
jgi:hypothetical protein